MFETKLDAKSVRLVTMIAVVGLLATLFSATSLNASSEMANATTSNLQVEVGGNFTCVLKDGGVKCVGGNQYGQLGNGSSGADHSNPVDVVGLSTGVTALELGGDHSCAIVNGDVKCWGRNQVNQLGDGTSTDSSRPVLVSGLSGVTAIGVGRSHACAIQELGAVKCWGYNDFGQLGNDSKASSTTPVPVMGLTGASALALGDWHSCALVSGTVKCWGYNGEGELGNGNTDEILTPVNVLNLSNVTKIAASEFHTCALNSSGGVKCWG